MSEEEHDLYNYALTQYTTLGHPTNYGGISKVYQFYKGRLRTELIRHMLGEVYAYSLHRKYKRPYQRSPYLILWPREQLHSDLASMLVYKGRQLPYYNDRYSYFMLTVDIFTKRVWLRPMKNKTARSSLQALQHTIQEVETSGPMTTPGSILFDNGLEYRNEVVTQYLEDKNINIMGVVTSLVKASFAERAIGTIKAMIYKHMTQNETLRWIDYLPQFERTYNNSYHRTIQCTPMEAEHPDNFDRVQARHMRNYSQKSLNQEQHVKQNDLEVGDMVRIRRQARTAFARGFHTWSHIEVFEIVDVIKDHLVALYKVKQLGTNEVLPRTLYRSEITPVNIEEYRISDILDRRRVNGQMYYLVKWVWYEESTWVPATQVTHYPAL